VFFCRDSFKVTLNITSEPWNFQTSTCEYTDIYCLTRINEKYALTGKKGEIYFLKPNMKLDSNLIFDSELKSTENGGIMYLSKWRNYFVCLTDSNELKLCEMTEKELKTLFIIPITKENINFFHLSQNYPNIVMVGCRDGRILYLDIEAELNLYWDRTRMREEEKASILFNNFLKSKANKKKKPGSGKKKAGKSSGKKPSSGKSKSKEKPGTASSKRTASEKPGTASSKKTVSEKPGTASSKKTVSVSEKSLKTEKDKPGTANSQKSANSGLEKPDSAKSRTSLGMSEEEKVEELPVIKEEKKAKKGGPKKAKAEKKEGKKPSKSVEPTKKKAKA
jgi:hypothetical protein